MPLLSSALCALALAWPQVPASDAYSQYSALELLPSDTLLVAEFNLEAWDRLREQAHASEITSGQALLRAGVANLGILPEGELRDLQEQVFRSHFTIAVTPRSLIDGGFIFAVEALEPDADRVSWQRVLWRAGARSMRPVKDGWIASFQLPVLTSGRKPMSSLGEWLGSVDESRLTDGLRWKALRQQFKTDDDIACVAALGWNLDGAFVSGLMGGGNSKRIDALLDFMLGNQREEVCAYYSCTIDESDILERVWVKPGAFFDRVWASGSHLDTLFEIAAAVPDEVAQIRFQELSGSGCADLLLNTVTLFAESVGGVALSAHEMLQQFAQLPLWLGPQVISYSSVAAASRGQFSEVHIESESRAEVETAWGAVPNEVRVALAAASAQRSGGLEVAWQQDRFVVKMGEGLQSLQRSEPSHRWHALHAPIKRFADGEPVFALTLIDASLDGVWLWSPHMRDGLAVLGLRLPELRWTDQNSDLKRPGYVASRRRGSWWEVEARSTFGVAPVAFLTELFALSTLTETDSFDESQF